MTMKYKVLVLWILAICSLPVEAQSYYEVVSKKLDVLSQPSLDAQVVGTLKEHDLVEVYNVINGWATIKYRETKAYVDPFCMKALEEAEAEQSEVSSQQPTQPAKPEKVTLRAGTEIPIQSTVEINAKKVKVGELIPFKVSKNIVIDGMVVIPNGTPVEGKVYEAVSAGKETLKMKTAKGKLGIRIDQIVLSGGIIVPLENGDIRGQEKRDYIFGKRADIVPAGYEINATVAQPATIKTY